MTTATNNGITWGSAAHFDREFVELMADGCPHVIGAGETKLRAAARRAAKAGTVTIESSAYGTIVRPVRRAP